MSTIEEADDESLQRVSDSLLALSQGNGTRSDQVAVQSATGWTPPNLLDTAQYTQLTRAAENRLSRAFLVSVNNALQTQAVTIMGIIVARKLLDRCLQLNGGSCESSRNVAKIARGVQKCVDTFGLKTQQCMKRMCQISNSMAQAGETLRFGGDPTAITREMLRKSAETAKREAQEVESEIEKTLEEVENALEWIFGNLERETVLEEEKQRVLEKRNAFEAVEEEFQVAQLAWYDRKAELAVSKSAVSDELSFCEKRLANTERQLNEICGAISDLQQYCVKLDGMVLDAFESESRQSSEAQRQIRDRMDKAIRHYQENAARDVETQIQSCRERIRQLDENIVQAQQLEMTADPGGTTTTRTNSSSSSHSYHNYSGSYYSWWYGWRSYSSSHHYHSSTQTTTTVVKPNKQREYTLLIERKRRQRSEEENALDRLSNKRVEVLNNSQAMVEKTNRMITDRQRQIASRMESHRRNMRDAKDRLGTQIECLKGQKARMTEEQGKLESAKLELSRELEEIQVKFERLLADRASVDRLKQRLDVAFAGWVEQCQAAEDKLRSVSSTFGQTGDTFMAYVRALQSLQAHARNLPLQFRSMETAFQSVEISLQSDSFLRQMEFIPQDRRREALKELTGNFQTVTEVAQTMMQQPVNALLMTSLAESFAACRGASLPEQSVTTSSVTVEEVK